MPIGWFSKGLIKLSLRIQRMHLNETLIVLPRGEDAFDSYEFFTFAREEEEGNKWAMSDERLASHAVPARRPFVNNDLPEHGGPEIEIERNYAAHKYRQSPSLPGCYTLIVHSIQSRVLHQPGEKWLLIMSPGGSTTDTVAGNSCWFKITTPCAGK